MKNSIQRLFDIPPLIAQHFGGVHPVFISNSANGIKTINATQYTEKSNAFCSYLLAIGLEKEDCVASIISNSSEYNFAEIGILKAGGIHVPLSALYSKKQLEHIFETVKPKIIITSSNSLMYRIQSVINELSFSCKIINIKSENVFDYPYSVIKNKEREDNILSDSIAVILFTSGSTNSPKGVALSHKNILTSVKEFSAADIFQRCKKSISFLQLNHSGERKVNYSCQLNGITICYPNSSKTILENISFFKPQITALVPFLLEELYKQMKHSDTFVDLKIICGGASIPLKHISNFQKLGIKIFEVYGLTETASLLAYNTEKNYKPGSVGKIATSIQIKFSSKGEVLVKGSNVMLGYFNGNLNRDSIRDFDEWFYTGDVGRLDEDGFLKITGRVKSAFKNSRGSYIYPEEIENELLRNNLFEDVLVFGENANSLLVALKLNADFFGSENLVQKINQIISKFNIDKNDEMKINKYLILDNEFSNDINPISMKKNRSKIAERINSNKQNFIAIN